MHLLPNKSFLWETPYIKQEVLHLQEAFTAFLAQPLTYRKKYLQKNYQKAFDGYSFMGQEDSLNQYATDLLHSFVLSDCSAFADFPKEFSGFLEKEWQALITAITSMEKTLIHSLQIEGLSAFYEAQIGHMISCNYYPKISDAQGYDLSERLSQHIDVSLFTVFIFGTAEGLHYSTDIAKNERLHNTDKVVIFPGYLLEILSQGKYKALPHWVDMTNMHKERFSFAFFSIPLPDRKWDLNTLSMSSEAYYKKYLSLF